MPIDAREIVDDDDEEEVTLATRGRTVSDMMSGMQITRDHSIYAHFTQDDLEAHFARFKQYDVDDSGFITPANLLAIFAALDMPEVTETHCKNMVEEVAILTSHDNDGQLSFRDYVHLMHYEEQKKTETEAAEALQEARLSMREEEPLDVGDAPAPVEEPPEPVEEVRMRGSSFAVLEKLAVNRIKKFEQAVADAQAKEGVGLKLAKQQKFADRLQKFKRIETATADPAAPGAEDLQKQSLKQKLAAFEAANKKDPIAFKKSWKNVRQGAWKQKTVIAGGVAPKKSLADLP